jgi:hypothetical protein
MFTLGAREAEPGDELGNMPSFRRRQATVMRRTLNI